MITNTDEIRAQTVSPLVENEKKLIIQKLLNNKSIKYIIGIDEVGRGPFFGPVSVAGVCIDITCFQNNSLENWSNNINDSKKLSEKKRQKLSSLVLSNYASSIAHISVDYINRYNINLAIQYGVYRTLSCLMRSLKVSSSNVIIIMDGNYSFKWPQKNMSYHLPPITMITKGDAKYFSIASASIIAKVARDALLIKAAKRFPEYQLEKNKGYGSAAHRQALKQFGATKFHRKKYIRNHI